MSRRYNIAYQKILQNVALEPSDQGFDPMQWIILRDLEWTGPVAGAGPFSNLPRVVRLGSIQQVRNKLRAIVDPDDFRSCIEKAGPALGPHRPRGSAVCWRLFQLWRR